MFNFIIVGMYGNITRTHFKTVLMILLSNAETLCYS